MRNSRIQMVEVLHVDYPRTLDITGYLDQKLGVYYFVCVDKKYDVMIVRDCDPKLFKFIKNEDVKPPFSYLKTSTIQSKYLETHFFRAQFLGWSKYERYPYCSLIEEIGPILNELNYKQITMLEQGISN